MVISHGILAGIVDTGRTQSLKYWLVLLTPVTLSRCNTGWYCRHRSHSVAAILAGIVDSGRTQSLQYWLVLLTAVALSRCNTGWYCRHRSHSVAEILAGIVDHWYPPMQIVHFVLKIPLNFIVQTVTLQLKSLQLYLIGCRIILK